jgi:hypothetical protein
LPSATASSRRETAPPATRPAWPRIRLDLRSVKYAATNITASTAPMINHSILVPLWNVIDITVTMTRRLALVVNNENPVRTDCTVFMAALRGFVVFF